MIVEDVRIDNIDLSKMDLNEIFRSKSWETTEKDENILTKKLIDTVEDAIKSTMEARSREKRTCDENGNKFSSNNLIPKPVRKLFRKDLILDFKFTFLYGLDLTPYM